LSLRVHRSDKSRHLVVRVSAGEVLPDCLAERLRDEGVACGWLRASGVLADVELRAFDAKLSTLGSARRIEGPVQVLVLEGSIGLVGGAPWLSLRGLLSRETNHGLETLAGEITGARTIALEAIVTVLDDLALERAIDEVAGVWLFASPDASPGDPAASAARRGLPATAPAWSAALEASSQTEPSPPRRQPSSLGSASAPIAAPIPLRPARRGPDLDAPTPEAGDVVDHFAFGRCDVLKSDGDRLHLKLQKDGRIREIALEMLRVTRVESDSGKRRFRLERRM
jgi:predicted DNA-binding protein with PD1-like motif